MPNEKVYRMEDDTRREVAVVWRDGSVDIGVDRGEPFRFLAMPVDVDEEFTGLWMTLDRHEINRLIKALRRARDAAYGRDE